MAGVRSHRPRAAVRLRFDGGNCPSWKANALATTFFRSSSHFRQLVSFRSQAISARPTASGSGSTGWRLVGIDIGATLATLASDGWCGRLCDGDVRDVWRGEAAFTVTRPAAP